MISTAGVLNIFLNFAALHFLQGTLQSTWIKSAIRAHDPYGKSHRHPNPNSRSYRCRFLPSHDIHYIIRCYVAVLYYIMCVQVSMMCSFRWSNKDFMVIQWNTWVISVKRSRFPAEKIMADVSRNWIPRYSFVLSPYVSWFMACTCPPLACFRSQTKPHHTIQYTTRCFAINCYTTTQNRWLYVTTIMAILGQ